MEDDDTVTKRPALVWPNVDRSEPLVSAYVTLFGISLGQQVFTQYDFSRSAGMTSQGEGPPEEAAPGFRLRWPDDWRALLRTRSNVLIVGSDSAIEAFFRVAADDLLKPVCRVSATHLPLNRAGTVVLTELTTLDDNQQQTLLGWLDQSPRAGTHVISIAPGPLLTPSTPSTVRLDLYYRLNTIYLELLD